MRPGQAEKRPPDTGHSHAGSTQDPPSKPDCTGAFVSQPVVRDRVKSHDSGSADGASEAYPCQIHGAPSDRKSMTGTKLLGKTPVFWALLTAQFGACHRFSCHPFFCHRFRMSASPGELKLGLGQLSNRLQGA